MDLKTKETLETYCQSHTDDLASAIQAALDYIDQLEQELTVYKKW